MDSSKVAAIIPAAGSGTRMGLSAPKQFFELNGIPILIHTLLVFQQTDAVGHIIVVVPQDNCSQVAELVQEYSLDKVLKVVAGGQFRQESVLAGLEVLPDEIEMVLVHDGVRPFVPVSVIENCIDVAEKEGAAMAAIPVKDTLKAVLPDGVVEHTIGRTGVWQAQTPQAARMSLLKKAYAEAAENKSFVATDEASLLEFINVPVKVVEGAEKNIKITRPEDLFLAQAILMESRGDTNVLDGSRDYRIGYGYDAHTLIEGRPLILGGITVSHARGLLGHSDADVLTHAVMDAIIGALGMGDIGQHFPDTDPAYMGTDSLSLLKTVMAWVKREGLIVNNLDATLVAEKPKLARHLPAMKEHLAEVLEVPSDRINIKATTTEGMGFCGRQEGMAAYAVISLTKGA